MCQVIRFPSDRVTPAKRKRRKAKVESMFSRPDARTLYNRASKIDESNDLNLVRLAERLYREAVRIDPTYAIAWTNLGNIVFRRKQYDEALALYKRALELDPEQPEVNYNLGYYYHNVGNLPGTAIAFYTEAIRLDPSFADAHYNLAVAYDSIREYSLARASFKRYIQLEPQGLWTERARQYLERSA